MAEVKVTSLYNWMLMLEIVRLLLVSVASILVSGLC